MLDTVVGEDVMQMMSIAHRREKKILQINPEKQWAVHIESINKAVKGMETKIQRPTFCAYY